MTTWGYASARVTRPRLMTSLAHSRSRMTPSGIPRYTRMGRVIGAHYAVVIRADMFGIIDLGQGHPMRSV